ncbi:MAG: alpha/beta hydrolase [Actinomycetota bacterium]
MTDPAAPPWFTAALAAPRREGRVDSGGCPINFLEWGEAACPGLVFVHGGAAHAHWWSFLAPLLADQWHAAALDLSGHGDSGRREAYSLEAWVDEVMTVAERAAFPGPPVVVGHSMGGLIAIQAASDHGDRLAGVVLVDAPLRRPDPESQEGSRTRAFRAPGIYPTREAAVGRFRLIPEQPVLHPFLFEHVAGHSVREVPGGWTWKFDPAVFLRPRPPMGERLAGVRCHLALIHGEHSAVVPPDIAAYTAEMMGPQAPVVPLPGAYHHLLLDQPLAFVAALRTLLLAWGHTGPLRTG